MKLRKTINGLNENESKLNAEIGQYKSKVDRINRERTEDKEKYESERDQIIEEKDRLIQQYNNTELQLKEKINLISFECLNTNIKDDKYRNNSLFAYLEVLKDNIRIYVDSIKESFDKNNKQELSEEGSKFFFNITLEDKQSSSQDEELERLQKENDDLQEINQDLENQIDELKQKEEQLKERIAELEEIGEEVTEKDTELNRLTGSLTSLSNFYFIFLFRRNRFTYFKNQPV